MARQKKTIKRIERSKRKICQNSFFNNDHDTLDGINLDNFCKCYIILQAIL